MHFLLQRKQSAALLALLLAFCVCVLSGCLESPVLVNYVLDPSSDNIDYDNPLKHYVPDPDATLTVQDIAATTDMTAEEVEEILYDDPIYDDAKDPTVEQPASSASYTPVQDSMTTTARQVDSPDGERNRNNKTVDSKEDGGAGNNPNSGDWADVGRGNVNPSDEDPDGDGQGDQNGGGNDGEGSEGSEVAPEDNPDSDEEAKATEPGLVFNGRGKVENLPTDLKTVCAVGDAAAIVLSVAGADCLVGADADFLASSNTQKVFGENALKGIAACWDDDGSEADDIHVDAIVKCEPSAVLMVSGSKSVSKDAQQELRDAGISILVLPQMASDTYIRKAVRAVGRVFSDKTEGQSEVKSQEYDAEVQRVLDAAKSTHGGSVTTFNSIDYDNVTDPTPTRNDAGAATNWTVLLTDWDEGATASVWFNGRIIFTESGVALAKVGWRWSPVSYYLGCGGVVNNAAAYASYSSDSVRMFLNFNENQVSYEWSNLNDDVTVGKEGGTFKQGGTYLLTNACDAQGAEVGHYLGSSDFKTVIAANKSIRKNLIRARKSPLGLYTPGGFEVTPSISGYGLVLDNHLLRTYSVVTDDSRGNELYSVVVNPCGMVGSWVEGSMESFLEAVWAASKFSDYEEDALRNDIRGFYSQFYGYELSEVELDDILDGSFAE